MKLRLRPADRARPATRASRVCRAALVAVAALAAFAGPSIGPAAAAPTSYYVALGDSLSRGFSATTNGDTDAGYVDRLYDTLARNHPGLKLVKLGCSGESSTSLVVGGVCTDRYPKGRSQLAAATAFLRAHRGAVDYLTIDIGANDVDACANGLTVDFACVAHGTRELVGNLARTLGELRAADPSVAHRAGMTYYNPFLAGTLLGAPARLGVAQSQLLVQASNLLESGLYAGAGWRVADVAAAFRTNETTPVAAPGLGRIPTNVATVCRYTSMCSNRNIHPTAAGYAAIAQSFAAVLG